MHSHVRVIDTGSVRIRTHVYNVVSHMPQLDPDRWRAASLRLDEALDLPEEERARWMAALREQDPVVADDVRALLEEHEIIQRERFLEEDHAFRTPANVEDDAVSVAGTLAYAGRIFGAYKLVSPIGQGGMGVVWLAERSDGAFEGRAAIKLLDIGRFGRSEARFRREANFLARLSHPNIAHLVDAGISSDGQPYLVLELVDGQPIDRDCDARRLDIPSRVRLFLDVLSAVSHAHAHRIVHRDIKPSNVLVRTDGHVKLLDFGIAKLLERDGEPSPMTTLTLDHGVALTPAYAAPEQVGARPVTTVTDVYALGVLLYVLLTGQHPHGEVSSPAALFKAITDVDTPLASTVVAAGKVAPTDRATRAASRSTTPERLHKLLKGDLDTIIAKALMKDPRERYASVEELADDLRRYLASEPIRARRDPLLRRTTRFVRRYAALTAAGAIAAVSLGTVVGFYVMRPATQPERAPSPEPQAPTPVTSEAGEENWPSLSPDGTRLAFSWVAPNTSTTYIAVKTLGSDAVVRLTESPTTDIMPIWSPDGQQIAFLRAFREPELRQQICLMPATGGPPRVLHTTGFGLPGLAWWTARRALLFPLRNATTGTFHLAVLDLATLDVRPLTNPPAAPLLSAPGDRLPAIAPDQRTVAFVRETHEGQDVFLLDLATSRERRLTRDHHKISGITWSPDGQAVIVSSDRSGVDALYRVALADGTIARVPQTADGATQPMAGPAGLVFSQALDDSNIYRVDLRDARAIGPARPIIASSRSDAAPHISPDGRSIAFLSTRAGSLDIWVASADGTNPRRLTSLPIWSGPRWSPDGQSIAFGAVPAEGVRPDIWVVDVADGTPRRLTTDPSWETVLAWAADGASLYFRSDRSGRFEVWNMSLRGGAATQVTHSGGLRAQESPDGRFLYYANDVPEVWRRALHASSADELVTRFPTGTHWGGDWVVGARGLYALDVNEPGAVAIDFLPFASGARAIRVASLQAPPARYVTVFAVAPDESWLVWAQDDYRNSDIMMVAPRGARAGREARTGPP
jgi:Tol biopolymer transport system component